MEGRPVACEYQSALRHSLARSLAWIFLGEELKSTALAFGVGMSCRLVIMMDNRVLKCTETVISGMLRKYYSVTLLL